MWRGWRRLVATFRQAEAHRADVDALVALAMRDLLAFWRQLSLEDASVVRQALEEVLPTLGAAYGEAAAVVGADWYADLRDEAGAPGAFAPDLPEQPGPERYRALAGWAVGPLFAATEADKALTRVAGGLQRVVAGMDRKAVEVNIERDPARARYARHASANACTFCRLLATRGAVYSEKSATRTLGGSKYHDACHCVAVPVWDEYEPAPYVNEWQDAYEAASGGSAKAVLSKMRSEMDASH